MPSLEHLQIEESHSLEEVYAFLTRTGIGDGLPVIPPTARRVEAMLGGRKPDEIVAIVEPAKGAAAWRALAQCAVMAGCLPEHLPVVAAATQAVADPGFNLLGVASTTGNTAVLLLVNGPIIPRLRFNSGGNALGPGSHANATVGRALSLVLRNVGGAIPGKRDMATQGQPAKYTCCFAENEGASPWGPLSVARGFTPDASTVTAFAIAGMVEVVDSGSSDATGVLTTMANSTAIAGTIGGAGTLGSGEPLILLAPEHAAKVGRDMSRIQAQRFLWTHARLPIAKLTDYAQERIAASREEEAQAPIEAIPIARGPEDIQIAVVGGVGQKSTYVPTWGGGTRAVTRIVAE
jgi:hypothetical protein